jgi:hypothetical protein
LPRIFSYSSTFSKIAKQSREDCTTEKNQEEGRKTFGESFEENRTKKIHAISARFAPIRFRPSHLQVVDEGQLLGLTQPAIIITTDLKLCIHARQQSVRNKASASTLRYG